MIEGVDYEAFGDGTTVWINTAAGDCIGRFGRMGVDVHTTVEAQKAGASHAWTAATTARCWSYGHASAAP